MYPTVGEVYGRRLQDDDEDRLDHARQWRLVIAVDAAKVTYVRFGDSVPESVVMKEWREYVADSEVMVVSM